MIVRGRAKFPPAVGPSGSVGEMARADATARHAEPTCRGARRIGMVAALAAGLALTVGVNCGGSSGRPRGAGTGGSPGAAGTSGAAGEGGWGGDAVGGAGGATGPVDTTVTVNTATRFQTMEGFGGSLAFYVNYLTEHPNRAEIYDLIFRELGLDVLRVGNWHQTAAVDAPTVAVVNAATASLGRAPRLLMSSWSPPATLKSNGDTKNGGTLAQQNGGYAYDQFATWWLASLQAYGERGVRPDFISIQNEPDFRASWETCLFGPVEGVDMANGGINVAGYDRAFEAVYAAVQTLDPIPRLLGPEVVGIASNKVQNYLARLNMMHLGGVAHHLYSGGTSTNPDTFIGAMQGVAAAAGSKPRWMTEFAPTPQNMFATAWLIHNAVTQEGVTAYIYWDLTWASPGGLVTTENPFQMATWTTSKGYVVRDAYHAVKHYARWIDTGWVRVAAASSATAIKASAYISPDEGQVTVVLLNTGAASVNVGVVTPGWTSGSSNVFLTAGADRTRDMGPLPGGDDGLTLRPRSIATVTFSP